MPRLRLMLMGLGLISLVWLVRWAPQSAYAQVPGAPGMNSNGVGASVGLNMAERGLIKKIRDSETALKNGDNVLAVDLLQYILNLAQDGFYRPDDDMSGRIISLKQQAETLLSRAGPATQQIYEQQYGAQARNMLSEAVAKRDIKSVQEITRKYLHTIAGADAAYWLGAYHLDRADYASALQCLMRLRRLPAASRFEPQLTLQIGLCLDRTGRPEKAQALIQEAARTAKTPIQLGDHTLTPGDTETQIAAWLRVLAPQQPQLAAEPSGWLMQRGNAERNLSLHSSPPVGKSRWSVPLTSWKIPDETNPDQEVTLDVSAQFRGLNQVHLDKEMTPLPATTPLLVNNIIVTRFYDHLSGFNAETGQEIWRSAENDRIFQFLYKSLTSTKPQVQDRIVNGFNNRLRSAREYLAVLIRQRTWEDLTFGGLSSDGEYVFSIEDLGVLNDISTQAGGALQTHPLVMRDYNRLCAYEVRTGKLKWELGGPGGDVTLNLPGTFFLGPPLPVDRRLYCLVESQAQTLLLTLDARTGNTLWSQSLSQPPDDLVREPNRRRAGISPALMGDLLICPTGSGLVVAVDVATQSLAWAYQYSTAISNDPRDPRMMRRRMALMGIPQVDMDPLRGAEVNEWQDGTPIVAEGHVILTPRDSSEIHCLSLEEGKTLWRLPRKDRQYVAAVQNGLVIVVGARSVEALRLDNGEPAWPQPVPLLNQAGRGIVTEKHIMLPLTSHEVATIDLMSGRALSRTRIHDAGGLGNLIPGPGIIISQTAETLSEFRGLDSVYEETIQRLAKNPQDPDALAQRGEYRLSQGELATGQADLRLSLQLQKSNETRTILFDSLLQSLQADFPGQRQLLTELEQLAQTRSQFSALYRTWAEGLLVAGELAPAFEILLKLSTPDTGLVELERLDGHRSIRRDRWVRTQLQELQLKLDQSTQQHVEAELRQRLNQAKAAPRIEPLRQFLQFFGSHPLADDARQTLVDRLLKTGYTVEVEQLLAQLRLSPQPATSGRALATMIQELIKIGHAEDCHQLLSTLVTDFSGVICLDNQTGQQLADSWKPQIEARSRFAADWPTGKVENERQPLVLKNNSWMFDVAVDGDRGPFYTDSQFKTKQELLQVIGTNGWGDPTWTLPLSELGSTNNITAFRAQIRNHLVFLTTGLQFNVLNTLTEGTAIRAKTLWHAGLIEGPLNDQNQAFQMIGNRPGLARPRGGMDRWQNPIGMVGAIEDDSVAILSGKHLALAEILSGPLLAAPLWKRTDMPAGSEIFGDREAILVAPPGGQDALQIRRSDGVTIGTHPMPPIQSRLFTVNQSVLAFERSPVKNALQFQLINIPAQQVTWERSFQLQSQFMVFSETELAVLEPTGMMSLIAISDGRIVWQQQLKLLPSFKDLWVIPDGDRLLVIHGEMPPRNLPRAGQMFIANNQTQIDGQADCVSRITGQPLWSQPIVRLALDYTLPQYLPCWIFTVRTMSTQAPNKPEFHLLVIDKRSGRVILKTTEETQASMIQVHMDEQQKRVNIMIIGTQPAQHILQYTDKPLDPVVDSPEAK